MEKDLKTLSASTVAKDDLNKARAEMEKLYDSLHIGEVFVTILRLFQLIGDTEFLDLRAHVWGIREFSAERGTTPF